MNQLFKKALNLTLQFEGGYSNNPNDPGGETNKGIIKTEYDKYRKSKNLPLQSIKLITDDELNDIYYNNYWLKASCDQIPGRLPVIHFDTAVNCGVTQSSKFLQRSVGVIADGVIGPKTIQTLNDIKNKVGLNDIIKSYLQQRIDYYYIISIRNPKLKVFLKGWINRVDKLSEVINDTTFYC